MVQLADPAPAPQPEDSRGGPIAGLVLAIPLSLLIWGAVMFVLFNLIR